MRRISPGTITFRRPFLPFGKCRGTLCASGSARPTSDKLALALRVPHPLQMRESIPAVVAFILIGCGSGSAPSGGQKPQTVPPPAAHVKITQFYSPDPLVPRGMSGKLCYGVENASKLELSPHADDVWPSPARCF